MSEIIERELCKADELSNNSMKQFDIKLDDSKTVQVLLIKTNNQLSCLAARCPHYSVPLKMGALYNGRIRCMAHGACFDALTGDIEDFPGPDCLPKFNITISDGLVYLKATRQELELKTRLKSLKTSNANRTSTTRPLGSAQLKRPKTSLDQRPLSALDDKLTKVTISVKPFKIPKCLIIGSGAAGLVCMDTLREHGFNSTESSVITVLTQDSHLPYDRPKLSKKLDVTYDACKIRDDNYFKTNNISFVPNQEVTEVNFNKKLVTCKSGDTYDYDKLVISTGLRASGMPNTPGNDLKGVFTLRSLDDSNNITKYFQDLCERITSGRELNVVLVGGSFISMETASYFIDKKAKTLVMSRSPPFEKSFGKEASNKIIQLHESKGVQFLVDKNFNVKEFKDSSDSPGVLNEIELINGDKYPCDLCLLALGGAPCTEFLKESGLNMNKGNLIEVNEHMQTNIEDVYAAGDITMFPRSCLPGLNQNESNLVNIGHWGLASSQGRVAGLSIVNSIKIDQVDSKLKVVPFFWSSQFGKSIRFSGYNDKYESIVFHQSDENQLKFAAFYISMGKVVGVCSLDWDPICALYAEAIQNGIEVRIEHIQNDPFDIKKLLLV